MLLLLIIICLGFGFLFALPKSLSAASKIFLSPALSILVFTQSLLFLAFIYGVNDLTIGASVFTVASTSLFIFIKKRDTLKLSRPSFVPYSLIIVATTVLAIIWFTQTVYPKNGMFWSGGGGISKTEK